MKSSASVSADAKKPKANASTAAAVSALNIKNATQAGPMSSLMLAKNWEPEKDDPTGWLISEKLDGVRCFWNGKEMFTRNGKPFYQPDWFTDLLPPDLALDGELWTKRDDFQRAVSIVRRQDKNDDWKEITYMVYDAPLLSGTFE